MSALEWITDSNRVYYDEEGKESRTLFEILEVEKVDVIIYRLNFVIYLYTSPSWLLQVARQSLSRRIREKVNPSLRVSMVPPAFKEVVTMQIILYKSSFDPAVFNNFLQGEDYRLWQISYRNPIKMTCLDPI